jgi:glycerol-3-phosphate dehydrogenase
LVLNTRLYFLAFPKGMFLEADFANMNQKTYDSIVIGGGIIGAGTARDAALRGFETLLVEKKDFASCTTACSTHFIHGGLRYLRMLEFKLVWQDLHQQEVLPGKPFYVAHYH